MDNLYRTAHGALLHSPKNPVLNPEGSFVLKLLSVVAALAVVSAGAMALAAPSFAQLPKSPAEAEKQLGITATQKAKMKTIEGKYKPKYEAINKKYQPKIEALRKQMAALNAQYGTEMKPLVGQMNGELDKVFTPAQKAKMKQWQAMQAQQQGGMGGAMGGGMP